ncbi:DNA methyltransferase 1-associated protein 1 isoform X1 [Chelonia mydas]|uniref:DNA methyltransferase 1-associated protein 1 isoform X1 n=1 Tax=Chelonia mydas TaxID=8469 RepID=UPI0018A1B890|nr:DNA methyltransferase 1-associated protein 1 isoform X1 [Chelonia mydas]
MLQRKAKPPQGFFQCDQGENSFLTPNMAFAMDCAIGPEVSSTVSFPDNSSFQTPPCCLFHLQVQACDFPLTHNESHLASRLCTLITLYTVVALTPLWSSQWDAPPLLPSDTTQGYRTVKAKLGSKKVRPWKWMPFTNPARKDGAMFYHWRRAAEEGKDYPFARFNKTVQVPVYSEQEYQMYLHDDAWTKVETDHLFDLSRRFDLRFVVIHDRYDHQQFKKRSVEDLKERYYHICAKLANVRAAPGTDLKIPVFDAGHERRRKEQLERLYNRTPEQVAEEEYLIQELRKIEARKKEREKRTQDLQKLITAADTTTEQRRAERKAPKKKLPQKKETEKPAVPETAGIKFPDFKSAGVTLRSQRMKLPSSVGQKKIKALEQMLMELGVDLSPMPTEEIVQMFNELRSDLVLLYELKQAFANCEYELQMLRHRHEALAKAGSLGPVGMEGARADGQAGLSAEEGKGDAKDQIIDVVGAPLTPNSRKRRESASSSSSIKKVKKP